MSKTKFYPVVTDTHIFWSKESLKRIDFNLEPLKNIEFSVHKELAQKAVRMLDLGFITDSEGEHITTLTPDEFLESDLFVNSPENQRKVIQYVIDEIILWK